LVGGDYPGVPLLELDGTIRFKSIEEVQDAQGQLRVALFWLADHADVSSGEHVTELADQTITISGLPGSYAFAVYVPPPPSVLRTIAGVDGELAIASALLYVDVDEDERWSPGVDWLVGGGREALIVWVENSLAVGETTLGHGYHTVGVARSPETGLTACGTPIPATASLTGVDVDVTLTIGLLHDVLIDDACDAQFDEYAICPPAPHIIELCADPATDPARCVPWAGC
jgi:hypothetical protein